MVDTLINALILDVSQKIDGIAKELETIGLHIWQKAKLRYGEYFAHGILSDYFKDEGFEVTEHYTSPSAF